MGVARRRGYSMGEGHGVQEARCDGGQSTLGIMPGLVVMQVMCEAKAMKTMNSNSTMCTWQTEIDT
jgi:hypothetical protein